MAETKDNRNHRSEPGLLSMLPWGISVLLHLGLVILAIAVVWANLDRPPEIVEQTVIPDIGWVSETPRLDPLRKPDLRLKPRIPKPGPRHTKNSYDDPIKDMGQQFPLVIGGPDSNLGQNGLSSIDLGSNDPIGDHVGMMGFNDNARKIAFVIDASGSLLDTMPFVIQELSASIRQLNDKQKFTVIFSQGDHPIEVPPRGLKTADHNTKRHVVRWIDSDSGHVVPSGSSNLVAAIKKALQYKPQLIFLLSDNITGHGRYEINQKRLVNQIQHSNTSGTRINTIQFLYPDPLVRIGLEPTMKLISRSSGGAYRFIDGRELGVVW